MNPNEEPRVIAGDVVVDDRGTVAFINAFDFQGVRRMYFVSNHRPGFVRAWHAHKREAKYVMAVQGAALVGAVRIDDWTSPSPDLPVARFVLSEHKPALLHVPPGYANGFMSLTADAKLLFLSTATLEESRDDDYRFPARLWDIWQIVER